MLALRSIAADSWAPFTSPTRAAAMEAQREHLTQFVLHYVLRGGNGENRFRQISCLYSLASTATGAIQTRSQLLDHGFALAQGAEDVACNIARSSVRCTGISAQTNSPKVRDRKVCREAPRRVSEAASNNRPTTAGSTPPGVSDSFPERLFVFFGGQRQIRE